MPLPHCVVNEDAACIRDSIVTVRHYVHNIVVLTLTVDHTLIILVVCYTGGFVEFLIGGMSYPDESVKSKVLFILTQVCSKAPPNSIPIPLVQNMCKHISTSLATAKSHDLTVNLLGESNLRLSM